jgi:antitoxin component of MazEF toxin-antitoxin module
MVKTLKKHGNSQALVIEKVLMEAIGIQADSLLQIVVSGNSLIVTPVHVGVGRERVTEAIDKLRPRYGAMLQRLAESTRE